MASIFLSYSRADRPKAQIIAEALSAEGFEVWWDKVLRAGETYDEVTETRLRDADAVIVLWSTVSVKSKWVRAEATLGQRTSVLIPAMIEEAERPIMFELTQSADLIGWEGDRSDPRWKAFVDDARGVIGKPAPAASSAPAAPAPDTTMELTFWTSIKDGDDAADLSIVMAAAQQGSQVVTSSGKQAQKEFAFGGQPSPVAVFAESLRHAADHTNFAGAVRVAPALGGFTCGARLQRLQRVMCGDTFNHLCGG